MIGQHREKQVDGVRSGVALLLRPSENSDPPGRQAAVSSADAQHHAAPRFCKESCQCGRGGLRHAVLFEYGGARFGVFSIMI
jgi:hypothetical protein